MTAAARFAMVALLALATHAASAESPQTLTEVPGKPAAPELALRDTERKPHRLSNARGKVVMVNFWATWCPPCRREMPSMQRAWEKLQGGNFEIYAVNLGEDDDTIFGFSFATGVELTFPILLDRDAKAIKAWPVVALPTSFIVDPQGRIVYRAVGGREWDDPLILEKIQVLLPPGAPAVRPPF
jgi:thiol-disulfide isomerase/thioredoxin